MVHLTGGSRLGGRDDIVCDKVFLLDVVLHGF